MNNETAKKGFKTFILTLSVSLIVFSVIYYALTTIASRQEQAELSQTTDTEISAAIHPSPTEEPSSPFQQLATANVDQYKGAVLAGATVSPTPTSTQSTTSVPATGVVSITLGLLFSLVAFVGGMYVMSNNPRKVALDGFEKNILKKL